VCCHGLLAKGAVHLDTRASGGVEGRTAARWGRVGTQRKTKKKQKKQTKQKQKACSKPFFKACSNAFL